MIHAMQRQVAWPSAEAEPEADEPEAHAGGVKRKAGGALPFAKKRKPAKLPKGASALVNKWQAVQKDLVRPCLQNCVTGFA